MARPLSPATSAHQAYLVHVLRNLLEYLYAPASCEGEALAISIDMPEELVCEMLDIRLALPSLPADLLNLVSLIGMQQMNEFEAARRLGVSRKSVNRWMWRAAALLQQHMTRPRAV